MYRTWSGAKRAQYVGLGIRESYPSKRVIHRTAEFKSNCGAQPDCRVYKRFVHSMANAAENVKAPRRLSFLAAGPGDGVLMVNEQRDAPGKKPCALWRKVEEITRAMRAEWNLAINA